MLLLLGRQAHAVRRARDLARELALRERRLHAAAYTDQLSGLPNRARFDLELAARFGADGEVGIIFLDLDGFKADQRHQRPPSGRRRDRGVGPPDRAGHP